MRPIDADKLREEWLWNGQNEQAYDTNDFLNSIDAEPTIDVEPVRRSQWVWNRREGHWECKRCGCIRSHDLVLGLDASYCGRCGARMDKEEANAEKSND